MDILKQLKKASKERQKLFAKTEWTLPEWGNATAGEVGEMCNIIKKIHRGDFTLEIADVAIYLDLLAQKAGLDFGTCIVNKFNKKSDEMKSDIKIYYY